RKYGIVVSLIAKNASVIVVPVLYRHLQGFSRSLANVAGKMAACIFNGKASVPPIFLFRGRPHGHAGPIPGETSMTSSVSSGARVQCPVEQSEDQYNLRQAFPDYPQVSEQWKAASLALRQAVQP